MHCFIGGSGSTGSSLLANVLNRHSKLFVGPETYLFTKHQLFLDWQTNKNSLVQGTLKSFPWHRYSRVDLLDKVYEWNPLQLQELIQYSSSIQEFSEEFFGNGRRSAKAYHWIEKTPSNAYFFAELSEVFPHCYLVHTIRNPYDTIASLNRRGFNIYYASALYLLNTLVGLSMRQYENFIPVVYEELVNAPLEIIKQLCKRLGLPFEMKMLMPATNHNNTGIESWSLNANDAISNKSVGGFANASRFVQEEIIYTINNLTVSKFYRERFKLDIFDIEGICEYLDFHHYKDDGLHNIFQLQIDKTRDHLSRIIKDYPSKFSKYPINFKI